MNCSCCVSPSHLDSTTGPGLSLEGYFCPQCHAKYTELPVECKVCGTSEGRIHCVFVTDQIKNLYFLPVASNLNVISFLVCIFCIVSKV